MSTLVNTLKQKVDTLKPKVSNEEQEARRAKVTCHFCGKKGHYESECPDKPKKADGG